jgi:hypothetical protein
MKKKTYKVRITASVAALEAIEAFGDLSGCEMVAWDWGTYSKNFKTECAKVASQYEKDSYWVIPSKYLQKL